ncbi:MAG: hypothetical protein ACO1RX_04385 [Candidatus Sericytochromatia bacterium]
MQLQALAGLQAQRDALDARRGAQAQQFYEQGLQAFAQAAQRGFRDKALLQQALEAWIQAVRQQRTQPEAYIALGYLFHMLGDKRSAVMYLKTAQQMAPQHPDPPMLLDLLLQRPSRAENEGDSEWESLENQLREWHARLPHWPRAQASLDPAICLGLSTSRDELQTALARLQQGLQSLEHSQDVAPLRQQLLPLEQQLQGYVQALKQSQQLQQLQRDLAAAHQQVKTASQNGLSAAGLEQLLDACDALADRVDALGEQPGSEPLFDAYAELANAVERLQDKLDEGGL